MKTIAITALAAILAVTLIFTPFSAAEAKKADTSKRLSPNSFGPHTDTKVSVAKTYDAKLKAQSAKADDLSHRKLIEAQKAQDFAKKKYGI